jgi:hypothetical protein
MYHKNIPITRLLFMVATPGVLLTLISSLTMGDMFTLATALTQNTTQGTVCTGNTCTATSCVNGTCKTITTNSGSADNFALNICNNGTCTSITKP